MREFLGFADDEQFVFHVLRHTFVSRLVQRGVPLKVPWGWWATSFVGKCARTNAVDTRPHLTPHATPRGVSPPYPLTVAIMDNKSPYESSIYGRDLTFRRT